MPLSVDYLTLVIAGALLFWVGANGPESDRLAWIEVVVMVVGTILFATGTVRALMSALAV